MHMTAEEVVDPLQSVAPVPAAGELCRSAVFAERCLRAILRTGGVLLTVHCCRAAGSRAQPNKKTFAAAFVR